MAHSIIEPVFDAVALTELGTQSRTHNDATVAQYIDHFAAGPASGSACPQLPTPFGKWAERSQKSVAALEQDAVMSNVFMNATQTLPAERVVVLDECSTHWGLRPTHAHISLGERAIADALRNTSKKSQPDRCVAPYWHEAGTRGRGSGQYEIVTTYMRTVLTLTLQSSDIVVLDNLSCHSAEAVWSSVEQTGATLLFLPPYQPDLSPLENAFSKMKTPLRQASAKTFDTLIKDLDQSLASISDIDIFGFFAMLNLSIPLNSSIYLGFAVGK